MTSRSLAMLLVCVMTVAGASLAQPAQPVQVQLPSSGLFILPVSAGQSVLRQCSRSSPSNVSQFWSPSLEQIQRLESALSTYIRLGDGPKPVIANSVQYHRQYVGIIVNGRRLIYGNFYPTSVSDYFDEKSTPVVVCDGGASFWGIVFEPESSKFLDLQVNGPA
jgi:hypothetical protein